MPGTNVVGISIDKFTQTLTAAGSSSVLTNLDNNNQIVLLDTAGGSTVTLPAATGTGAQFKFVVSVLATTANHIVKVANSVDAMIGLILVEDSDTASVLDAFAANSTSDTITLNRSTTGSVAKGEWFEAQDIASGVWFVRGFVSATGTPATPFSSTV